MSIDGARFAAQPRLVLRMPNPPSLVDPDMSLDVDFGGAFHCFSLCLHQGVALKLCPG